MGSKQMSGRIGKAFNLRRIGDYLGGTCSLLFGIANPYSAQRISHSNSNGGHAARNRDSFISYVRRSADMVLWV